jgi:hypothetical protein
MTRDVFWYIDLSATLGALLVLLVAYRRLGRFRKGRTAEISHQYIFHATSISAFAAVYAGFVVLFDLGSSWLVGPTACGVLLVDMIHTETNRHR